MRAVGWIALVVVLLVVVSAGGCALGWFNRATQLVSEQVDPYALQRKYELFKDEAAQLDAKVADISVYKQRLKAARCGSARDRVAIERCTIWEQEVAGIVASYNGLAADYNAQMSKWNYAFCNVGSLPKGAEVPLPREFKRYQYE